MTSPDAAWIPAPPLDHARASELFAHLVADPPALGTADRIVRAAALAVPLVLSGPSLAACRRLARIVHALGGRPGPLLIPSGAPTDVTLPDGASVLLDATAVDDPAAELLREALIDDGAVWVLLAAPGATSIAPDLARRSGQLTLEPAAATPERLGDVAALIMSELVAPTDDVPALSAEALAWLRERPDVGDSDALVGHLRRALVLAPAGATIDASHLAGEAVPSDGSMTTTTEPHDARLEYVVAELAHELRNPLVTLKTVADHLAELAQDPELRDRFTTLAGEAVERMDDLLDNLVAFSRLEAPAPRTIPLASVLETALDAARDTLETRQLDVRCIASDARCIADPAYLAYALRNVLVGIAHEATPRHELLLDTSVNGVVRLRFATESSGARLKHLVLPDEHPGLRDPTFLPLAFSLARAVLEQTGGRLDVTPEDDGGVAVEVHVPPSAAPPTE